MQDKIQEIMVLVDAYRDTDKKCGSYTYNATTADARALLESKIRELVREPLSDDEVQGIFDKHHEEFASGEIQEISILTFTRAIERAHGITNTSGVE